MPEQPSDQSQQPAVTSRTITTTTTTIAVARDGRVIMTEGGEGALSLTGATTDGTPGSMEPLVLITTETVTDSGGSGGGDPLPPPKGPMGGGVPGE